MEQTEEKIHRQMTIDEVFMKYPQKAQKLAQTLTKAGLNCVGCSASTWETIESGCLRHGKTEADTDALLRQLQAVLEETSDASTITITQKAADKFKEICAAEGKTLVAIRFDEKPAGCSGFEYDLDFSTGATENDVIFHGFGVYIHVDKRVLKHLLGCEIDYLDGLHSGFKISNPNVSSSCGCGSSHGY